jgi:hypothetical protein
MYRHKGSVTFSGKINVIIRDENVVIQPNGKINFILHPDPPNDITTVVIQPDADIDFNMFCLILLGDHIDVIIWLDNDVIISDNNDNI